MARKIDGPDKAQFIAPLNMNGLQGRVLRIPAAKKREREILFVYGHHSQLERWWGLIENLRKYGTVTVPDLPGFGGMDSFYKIGKKPTLDNYADYLAAFVRMQYRRRRLTLVGMTFGFAVVTRMLQRYPDMANKVDTLVSIIGVTHHDDLSLSPAKQRLLRVICRVLASPPMPHIHSAMTRSLPFGHRLFAGLGTNIKTRLAFDPFVEGIGQEADRQLWLRNDIRSHWYTFSEMLALDNCRRRVGLPVWQLHASDDAFIDRSVAEQHLLVVYAAAHTVSLNWDVNKGGESIQSFELPAALRRILS